MKRERVNAPKGVSEYVPPRSSAFEWVRDNLIEPAALAGYQLIELPLKFLQIRTRVYRISPLPKTPVYP